MKGYDDFLKLKINRKKSQFLICNFHRVFSTDVNAPAQRAPNGDRGLRLSLLGFLRHLRRRHHRLRSAFGSRARLLCRLLLSLWKTTANQCQGVAEG